MKKSTEELRDYLVSISEENREYLKKCLNADSSESDAIANKLIAQGSGLLEHMFGDKSYEDVLFEATEKLKIKIERSAGISLMEDAILQKIVTDSLDEMSEKEKQDFYDSILKEYANDPMISSEVKAAGGLVDLVLNNRSRFGFYIYATVLVNSLYKTLTGVGLPVALNTVLGRILKISISPVGLGIKGILLIFQISEKSMQRVIIAISHIALLKKQSTIENLLLEN